MHGRVCKTVNVVSDLCALCGKHVGTSLVFDGEGGQLGGVLSFLSIWGNGIGDQLGNLKVTKGHRKSSDLLFGSNESHHECASIASNGRKTRTNALVLGPIDSPSQITKSRSHHHRTLQLQTALKTHLRSWNTRCIFPTARILFRICCLLAAWSDGGRARSTAWPSSSSYSSSSSSMFSSSSGLHVVRIASSISVTSGIHARS
jgi:hypothetical protein